MFILDVEFQSQPQNMTTVVGETVTFICAYDVVKERTAAIWEINLLRYTASSPLPQQHMITNNINGSFLSVYDIDLSMDGYTYRCVVNSCFSTIGHLSVIQGQHFHDVCLIYQK